MPPVVPQPSGAASPPHGHTRSWHSSALNIAAMLAYFALVILLQRACAQVVPLEQQQPVIIVASTLIIAAALAPLLFLVRRRERRPRPRARAASAIASAAALLGAVALAIPIYLVSVILLQWAVRFVVSSSEALPSMAIVLATLVALVCGEALFIFFRRALQTGGTR
ncbi:MAG: hypothetical protein ACXWP6_09790 [Ktedonobacterales bacterium]